MKTAQKESKTILTILLVSVLPILILYLPFALHLKNFWGIPLGESGMQVIFANWDGPNYVYNAITNYSPSAISAKPFLNVAAYYPAHFPALVWIMMPFSWIFGFFWGPLILQIISGFVLNLCFYYFVKGKSKHALWLTFAFTFFPPRYLAVRAVVGADVWIVAAIILSLFFWEKGKYFISGFFALLATTFKFQALVLPIAFFVFLILDFYKTKKVDFAKLAAAIIGFCGYIFVAYYYQLVTGNFNAYFEAQKLVGMNAAIPFAMFNHAQKWVGTGWMESAAIYFVAMFVMIAKLMSDKKYIYAIFAFMYTAMLSLIPQVDIMRLAMPLTPLFFYTFSDVLSSKYFRWGLVASLPVIYLFTINFIVKNQAPITDWSMFR